MTFNWHNIIESMDTALIVVNQQENIVAINTSAEDLLLMSRRLVEGKQLRDVFVRQKNLMTVIKRAFNTVSRFTLREIEFDQHTHFEADITLTPVMIEDSEKSILMEIVRTDRVNRLIQETRNIEQQQSNRLMMRSMSHEIKNPLSGIRGAAQLLSSELQDPELKEFTDIIIRESDRLTNLVSRVMGSHRKYDSEPVNIHYVTEHVARLIQVSNQPKLTIKKDYDPSLPEIMGDVEQIIQAVMNIVKNAVEAQEGAPNQFVGIRTRLERNFTIGKVLYRNLIKLQIWDHGGGVPKEIRDLIFNPMITGRAEGTGLGLAISQEIIQRHDGLIVLEEFNEHTCFSIYLPIARKQVNE